jgi:hypothetical protein
VVRPGGERPRPQRLHLDSPGRHGKAQRIQRKGHADAVALACVAIGSRPAIPRAKQCNQQPRQQGPEQHRQLAHAHQHAVGSLQLGAGHHRRHDGRADGMPKAVARPMPSDSA